MGVGSGGQRGPCLPLDFHIVDKVLFFGVFCYFPVFFSAALRRRGLIVLFFGLFYYFSVFFAIFRSFFRCPFPGNFSADALGCDTHFTFLFKRTV